MAARSWQDELARQAEEGSARLREMLSVGLGFLRTELGLDLGLEPKRYPGWVILVGTGALGLLLLCLLGYGWAAACAGARRKRRSPPRRREEAAAPASAPDDLALLKGLRGDEQKKKNRKKLPEKPKVSREERRAGEGGEGAPRSSRDWSGKRWAGREPGRGSVSPGGGGRWARSLEVAGEGPGETWGTLGKRRTGGSDSLEEGSRTGRGSVSVQQPGGSSRFGDPEACGSAARVLGPSGGGGTRWDDCARQTDVWLESR